MKLQIDDKYAIVIFDKEINIFSIEEQFETFKQALNSKKPVLLQAKEIEKIDPASLQLLISFILEIRNKKINLQWQNPSVALCKSVDTLGLRRILEFPGISENKNANRS